MTTSETVRAYPCDDFVVAPTVQAWRGVRIDAPVAVVWPWVAQVRLGPAPALSVGDLIMARRQLLNLKDLAERSRPGR